MAYSEGQLNGAQDYRVGIDVWYSGTQDWNANTSRFDWNVRIVGTYGSWTNGTCYWSSSIGGVNYNGTFTLPSGWGSPRIVASGNTWHAHDSRGYRSGFASSAYMNVPHSNIGEGGSGNAWVDAPRIPKTPLAPTMLPIDTITNDSFRVRFSSNDNGGRSILERQIQTATNSGFTADLYTAASNGTTTVGGRPEVTQHWARARERNDRGWSPWSSSVNATTKADPPSTPVSVAIMATGVGELTLSWSAPASNGGKAISGYDIQWSRQSNFSTIDGSASVGVVTSRVITGLVAGALYYVRIRAKNVDYAGSWVTVSLLAAAGVKVWTGTTWKPAVLKRWDGSSWVVVRMKVWTGSEWVDGN